MRFHVPNLQNEDAETFEGIFLVRVQSAQYCWQSPKPHLTIRFSVLQPAELHLRSFTGRLYCTPKAVWRLSCFLRDFGYDPDLLNQKQVDEQAMLGLEGVVQTTRKTFGGHRFLSLERFAPSSDWPSLINSSSASTIG